MSANQCSFEVNPNDADNPTVIGCNAGENCAPDQPLGGGVVSPCETILYTARLAYSGGGTCAFGGGQFTLTTPDSTVHTINSDVPCLGGTVAPCVAGVTEIVSGVFAFTVSGPGPITASANYANGVAHNGTIDQPGVTGSTPDTHTAISCDDNNACTTDTCDPAGQGLDACVNTPVVCNDNNECTSDTCDPATGCTSSPITPCDDGNACTNDTCDPATGCTSSPISPCNDGDACTNDTCNPATGCTSSPISPCDDGNACTTDTCDPATGCTSSPIAACDDGDVCTTDTCDPATGCTSTPGALDCDDNDICTDDICDPQFGCVNTPDPTNDVSCQPVGCRITGGGISPNSPDVDLGEFADTIDVHFGGQVGAPCGCIGCFDEFGHIQGEWQTQRRKQKGNFHASEFNSLVCGCQDVEGQPAVLDGNLCNPDDRVAGPEPRPAPANVACFAGKGTLKKGNNLIDVAFRVEVEDRGEPGAGDNAEPTDDVYRIRIWVPKGQETVESLSAGACCLNTTPTGDAARNPDISDGGNLVHGNIQIHPQIPSHVGECPVPNTMCPD